MRTRTKRIMISLFDRTTVMAQPWARAGYTCYCVDIQHKRGETREGNIIKVGADVTNWLPPSDGDIGFLAAFPPCTFVACSGARWFPERGLGGIIDALQNFKRSVDIATMVRVPFMIENPVSTISSYWRKPDYIFHPWHYGDAYEKTTCLWVGQGFRMPRRTPVKPVLGKKLYLLPPSEDRGDLRSVTPQGFAEAVFKANHRQR